MNTTRHARFAPAATLPAARRRAHPPFLLILRRRLRYSLLATFFCASFFSQTIEAATTCVPRAIGVPGQYAPPNWWNTGAPANAPDRFSNRLDDPRWRSAANYTRGGVNVGALQFNLTPTFAVEGVYNFHNVFTPGTDARFSTLQGGVRFRF